MRIGYIIPSCGISGGVGVVCQHANRLLERGHEVVLLALDKPEGLAWFPKQRVPVVQAAQWKDPLDVLIATGWKTAFWLPKIRAQVKCYFVQSDETRFYPEKSIQRQLAMLSYFSRVHYFTEAKWIQAWLKQTFGHDSFLVPNGLDGSLFFPDEPLVPKSSRPRVLLEGSISLPFKGMQEAFEAVMPLDVEIWCVSSSGRVKKDWRCDQFFEHVPMTRMRKIYSSCDVLLKMSRVEGFFGPPMEMMACGGVNVVAKVTGYDEYIIDRENALVVEAGDVLGARAAVQELLENRLLREQMVERGLKTAAAWRWDSSIELLEKELNGLFEKSLSEVSPEGEPTGKSLIEIYENLQGIVKDSDLTVSSEVPYVAVKLASLLASKPIFWRISILTRWVYRATRRFKSRVSST